MKYAYLFSVVAVLGCASFALGKLESPSPAGRACLPVGDKAIRMLPFDKEIVLDRTIRVGSTVFEKGCKIWISYGPEYGSDESPDEINMKKVIETVRCEKPVRIDKFRILSTFSFDKSFCLDGLTQLSHEISACGKKWPSGSYVPFYDGLPDCDRKGDARRD